MNIDNKNLCISCFEEYTENQEKCQFCGHSAKNPEEPATNLPIGTVLMGRYVIGRMLGKGGFGITYLAYDLNNTCKVAIKEYMPDNLSYRAPGSTLVSTYLGEKEDHFRQGSEKFFEEARTISKFNGHPNIIHVYEFFYENNTAYFVMEYINGVDLKTYVMQNGGKITEEECIRLILPIMDALIIVHSIGILHRDISPDNIYITKDGSVKLLDFGAARQVLGEKSKSLSVILKQGFAPFEQYQTRGNQGPWTDIYSLAATMYYCLVGQVPESAMDRINREELKTLSILGVNVQPKLEKILSKALSIKETNRYKTMAEFRQALANIEFVSAEENKTTAIKTDVRSDVKRRNLFIPIAAAVGIILTFICVGFALYNIFSYGSNSIASNRGMSLDTGEVSSGVDSKESSTDTAIDEVNSSENTASVETSDVNQTNTTVESSTQTTQNSETKAKQEATNNSEVTQKPASTQTTQSSEMKAKQEATNNSEVTQKPASTQTTQSSETKTKQEATNNSEVTQNPASTPKPTVTPKPASNTGTSDTQTTMGEKADVTKVNNVDYIYVTSVFSVKAKYTGEWKDNKPNGYGELIIAGASDYCAHGDKLTGNFTNGVLNGKAKCDYADGAYYDGNFLNGLRHGKGTLLLSSGDKYEGQFKDDFVEGTGTFTYANGARYVGEFKHNSIEGKGIKYFINGDRYEGQFVNANREGNGTYFFANGAKYVGLWKNDVREGQGTMTWETGNTYVGQWKNDVMEGQGTYTWKDGRKYVGEWVNNKIEGQGSYYDQDGNLIKQGKWSNNNFVG